LQHGKRQRTQRGQKAKERQGSLAMHNKHARATVTQRLIEEGVREKLERMAADATLNTPSSYSPNAESHPDNQISFVDRHIEYLLNHPKLDSEHYLANLRMKIRSR
jgi:hypothetical protein